MIAKYFKPAAALVLFGWLGFLVAFQIDSGAGGGSRASNQIMAWVYDLTEIIGAVPTGLLIAALGPVAAYALWRKAGQESEA